MHCSVFPLVGGMAAKLPNGRGPGILHGQRSYDGLNRVRDLFPQFRSSTRNLAGCLDTRWLVAYGMPEGVAISRSCFFERRIASNATSDEVAASGLTAPAALSERAVGAAPGGSLLPRELFRLIRSNSLIPSYRDEAPVFEPREFLFLSDVVRSFGVFNEDYSPALTVKPHRDWSN